MGISVSFDSRRVALPGEHISRHTGRPTGRFHLHHHHPRCPAPVVFHEHISRHTGRPTGRPHIHRHSFHHYATTNPVTVSGSTVAITLGILSLITGIALLTFGGVAFNPVLLGIGGGLAGLGILAIGSGAAYLCIHNLRHRNDKAAEPNPLASGET